MVRHKWGSIKFLKYLSPNLLDIFHRTGGGFVFKKEFRREIGLGRVGAQDGVDDLLRRVGKPD